jgi:hypothetical protein
MDTAVGLVQAYLHLNGYLVLTEVPVQLRAGAGYYTETDLDILAVRFPQREERYSDPSSEWEAFFRGEDPALDLRNDSMDFIVGEVKEGRSHANPALRRRATIHFALRRIGCCDEATIPAVVAEIAQRGEARVPVPGGGACRIRLVIFGGHGEWHDEGLTEIPLRHVTLFLQDRLRQHRDVLQGIEFRDATLGILRLMDKLGLELDVARQPVAGARPAEGEPPPGQEPPRARTIRQRRWTRTRRNPRP